MEQGRFVELSQQYLREYLKKIEESVALLSEDQVWWRPNAHSNSVGNLLLHLSGNLTQWVLDGLGGQTHVRHRSQEFAADRGVTKGAMLQGLREVVGACVAVAGSLGAQDLAAQRQIQGRDTDGLGALYVAVQHTSYHAGQIVQLAKQLTAAGAIDFYPQLR